MIAYAMQLAKYKSDNVYCNSRREFLSREIDGIIASNKERAVKYLEAISINDFYMGDFLTHVDHAKQLGHGVMVFAPTYKGGYERQYRFINDNIDWPDSPSYEVYDPKHTHDLITRMYDEKLDFAFFSDQLFPDIKPAMVYEGSSKPVYSYLSGQKSSVRRDAPKHKAFKYEAVQPEKLRPDSEITAVAVKSDAMNFLKDIYLAKGIAHKSGMFNVLFFADDALIGGAIYSLPQFGDKIRRIYLLSDFSVSRERRLSKLVAMLATARPIVDVLNKKFFIRIDQVLTTAFTKKPVSMKYRGIYKLDAKKDGFLNYSSHVREGSLNDTYTDWWRKYGSKN